jgi:hypothetical protein
MTGSKVLAICHSDKEAGRYALFYDDKRLCLWDSPVREAGGECPGDKPAGGNGGLAAVLPTISLSDKPVKIYYHHPYVCVTERFGVNAAVADLRDGGVRVLSREDYHADVSSYSIGFLEREGRTLLIHQTKWNRLDMTDLATGELLTDREIINREIAAGRREPDGDWGSPQYETKNYDDYFHSLLHVSPDNKSFLSNGWIWSPVDIITAYGVERFLKEYEPAGRNIDFGGGYNWDRPCAFIDNDLFVIAADTGGGMDDNPSPPGGEGKGNSVYGPLMFYRLSAEGEYIRCEKEVPCEAFAVNKYGEVSGELYYDGERLVALSGRGAFALTLEGETIRHEAEIRFSGYTTHTDFGSRYAPEPGWQYSPEHRLFYRYSPEKRLVEERPFPA